MSGGLLGLNFRNPKGFEDLRLCEPKKLNSRFGYSICAPFGHGRRLDLTKFCDSRGSAKRVDDFGWGCGFVHSPMLGEPNT
jgi:hypothetical protein